MDPDRELEPADESDPASRPTHHLKDIKVGDHGVQLLVSTMDHVYDAENVEAGMGSWQVIGTWDESSIPELSKVLSNRQAMIDRSELARKGTAFGTRGQRLGTQGQRFGTPNTGDSVNT